MANQSDYIVFLFTSPMNRSFGFKTYTNEFGQVVGFLDGKDKDGQPIYHRWKFDQDGARTIRVHRNKTDVSLEKLNAVEFLRKSPNCKGSPNGSYSADGTQVDIYFEEMNDEKAAKEGLAAEMERIEAQNLALKVKGQDFIDLCALIGVFNKDESIMRFSLVDFAKNKPEKFTELYNDPVRQIKSVIRRGVSTGIIVKEGRMYSWENQLLGVDEEDAVHKLKTEDNLLKALKAHLDKLK
jgi:hypothetical protein